MANAPAVIINVLKVEPAKQQALLGLLKANIENVVKGLDGWKSTRLIAARDGTAVVIHSEWESPAAAEAMRNDPRMKAYFPKIMELATFDSTLGETVLSESRRAA